MEPRVVDNPAELRYELWLGDELVGEIRYTREEDGTVVLVHTEVDPATSARDSATFSSRVRSTTSANAGSRTGRSARS